MTNIDALHPGLKAALADHYTLERELGRGGMAVVYLATDVKHDRQVAVKVLLPDLAATIGHERFLREIRIAAKLTHPHILPLYDSGAAAGQLYYVMPYIDGESLRDRLDREGPLGVDDARQIVREVGSALSYAHEHKIVHRDIKPDNIMLSGGHAVVADFGIATAVSEAGGEKLTQTGLSVGTPRYMSPEQGAGESKLDARSDQYSLACVAYELLAGQPPFTGPNTMAVIRQHTLDPVPSLRTLRAGVSEDLEAVINRALEKSPADRYPTVEQFVQAVSGEQGRGTAARAAKVAPLRIPRRLAWIAAAAAVVVGAVFVGRRIDFATLFSPEQEQLVAVLDFDGLGLDSLDYLTQAIPEFLALALTGETGGPRAIDRRVVTRAWNNVQGMTADMQERYRRVAEELGATHVLTGTVIRQPTGVLVQATLRRGREVVTEASVTAPEEDAIGVAEAVGVQLLASSAGEFERLPGLASSSTAAVRDWLKGTEAYRRGDYEVSLALFSKAVDADTTFALAAWGISLSAGWLDGKGRENVRGTRLAWLHRDRLPPADSAIFVAKAASDGIPEFIGVRATVDLYQRAVQRYPNRWDSWVQYGDYLWHEGGAYIDDGRTMAVDAFRRAMALDTVSYDEPWRHLGEHAMLTRDLDALREIPPQFQDPFLQPLFEKLFVLMAGAELDSSAYPHPGIGLMMLQAVGEGMEGAERLAEILSIEAADGDANSAGEASLFALNRGQPGRAAELVRISGTSGGYQPELWIQAGLYWDADSNEVRRVRDSLEVATLEISAQAVASGDHDEWVKLHQRCWLAISDLGRDDGVDLEETAALARQAEGLADNLRRSRWPAMCARFLEALSAIQAGDPSAGARVAAADSAYSVGVPTHLQVVWGTLLADMYREIGEPQRSIGILRRQWMRFGVEYIQFLAPRLLRRARLATELGYRDEAIQSYQHYLWLRSDPEPVLADQVAAVRMELAELLGE
ncbi:MAG: serine/threonine-protein kinase [Gemmatimonadales bacterium]